MRKYFNFADIDLDRGELEEWCDSRETSLAVGAAIHEYCKRKNDKVGENIHTPIFIFYAEDVWGNGGDGIEERARELALPGAEFEEELPLNWGCETIGD